MNKLQVTGAVAFLAMALGGCMLFRTDAQRGLDVAGTWCAECHRIAPDQPSGMRPGHILPPRVAAPSFMDIAARPAMGAASLDHFLADLHLPMPTYRLSAEERRAVVAYILSLRPDH